VVAGTEAGAGELPIVPPLPEVRAAHGSGVMPGVTLVRRMYGSGLEDPLKPLTCTSNPPKSAGRTKVETLSFPVPRLMDVDRSGELRNGMSFSVSGVGVVASVPPAAAVSGTPVLRSGELRNGELRSGEAGTPVALPYSTRS